MDAYHGLHPELSNHHAGMTVIDGNPIFTTTLLHVSATGRLGQAGWWLWFDGEPEGADLGFCFGAMRTGSTLSICSGLRSKRWA